MKLFDPENAEMVDDAEEASELEGFLGRVDTSVKSIRVRVIEEAFRELTKVAKKENNRLLDAASEKFCEEMGKVQEAVCADVAKVETTVGKVAESVATIAAEAATQAKRANNRMDALNAKSKEMEECMKEMAAMAKQPPMAAPMPDMEDDTEEEDDAPDPRIQTILDAVQKLQNTPAPARPTWNFKIQRDDYARISNIIATPVS
jgi:hypothetical protein